jgi:branched-chain amino acid aminotransferase
MSEQVWINGELRDAAEPWLRPDCAGWLTGRGVFETLLGCEGVPLRVDRHLRRLNQGVIRLGLVAPSIDPAAIEEAFGLLMARNGCADGSARLRITVVPGTVMISAKALAPYPTTISVGTSPFVRNERSALTGIKSTSYSENLLALEEAQARGAGEAILANTREQLCEGATSNVFIVEGAVVTTPPLTSGCLAGVMRELVIEWCEAHALPLREEPLPMEILRTCREAFLTSSLRGVQAVEEIDGRQIGPPGGTTLRIRAGLGLA